LSAPNYKHLIGCTHKNHHIEQEYHQNHELVTLLLAMLKITLGSNCLPGSSWLILLVLISSNPSVHEILTVNRSNKDMIFS
jgi:hypothetical protein